MPDLPRRRFESAPGLRPQNWPLDQPDGPPRFRELPGQPSAGGVLVIRRNVPEVPSPADRASISPHQVARKHGCHNRPPLASTIDAEWGLIQMLMAKLQRKRERESKRAK